MARTKRVGPKQMSKEELRELREAQEASDEDSEAESSSSQMEMTSEVFNEASDLKVDAYYDILDDDSDPWEVRVVGLDTDSESKQCVRVHLVGFSSAGDRRIVFVKDNWFSHGTFTSKDSADLSTEDLIQRAIQRDRELPLCECLKEITAVDQMSAQQLATCIRIPPLTLNRILAEELTADSFEWKQSTELRAIARYCMAWSWEYACQWHISDCEHVDGTAVDAELSDEFDYHWFTYEDSEENNNEVDKGKNAQTDDRKSEERIQSAKTQTEVSADSSALPIRYCKPPPPPPRKPQRTASKSAPTIGSTEKSGSKTQGLLDSETDEQNEDAIGSGNDDEEIEGEDVTCDSQLNAEETEDCGPDENRYYQLSSVFPTNLAFVKRYKGEDGFQCPLSGCTECYKSWVAFRTHVVLVHMGFTWHCGHCPIPERSVRIWKSPSGLMRHYKTYHKGSHWTNGGLVVPNGPKPKLDAFRATTVVLRKVTETDYVSRLGPFDEMAPKKKAKAKPKKMSAKKRSLIEMISTTPSSKKSKPKAKRRKSETSATKENVVIDLVDDCDSEETESESVTPPTKRARISAKQKTTKILTDNILKKKVKSKKVSKSKPSKTKRVVAKKKDPIKATAHRKYKGVERNVGDVSDALGGVPQIEYRAAADFWDETQQKVVHFTGDSWYKRDWMAALEFDYLWVAKMSRAVGSHCWKLETLNFGLSVERLQKRVNRSYKELPELSEMYEAVLSSAQQRVVENKEAAEKVMSPFFAAMPPTAESTDMRPMASRNIVYSADDVWAHKHAADLSSDNATAAAGQSQDVCNGDDNGDSEMAPKTQKAKTSDISAKNVQIDLTSDSRMDTVTRGFEATDEHLPTSKRRIPASKYNGNHYWNAENIHKKRPIGPRIEIADFETRFVATDGTALIRVLEGGTEDGELVEERIEMKRATTSFFGCAFLHLISERVANDYESATGCEQVYV